MIKSNILKNFSKPTTFEPTVYSKPPVYSHANVEPTDTNDQQLPSTDEEWKRIEREVQSENEYSPFTNVTSLSSAVSELESKADSKSEETKK